MPSGSVDDKKAIIIGGGPAGLTAALELSKLGVAATVLEADKQVGGIARMIEEDRYCIDILTQIQAIKAALRKVEDELLKSHSNHCVAAAIKGGVKAEKYYEQEIVGKGLKELATATP